MNGSACSALLEQVAWDNPSLIASLVVLLLISVMVIVGNCLVIAAVFISSKLRSVTNLFIVSLAVADLMVGLAVLPFSATWEVFKVSPFSCFLLERFESRLMEAHYVLRFSRNQKSHLTKTMNSM